jgi:hypothetical protein
VASSSCGLLIDGAYLVSNKRYTKEEKQSRPLELQQTALEHEVRAQPGQAWLACEDVQRNVERVWTVQKQYEHRGGLYQAHWLPLLLDSVIGGALTIGFGVSCQRDATPESCNGLYGTIPLWTDALYSAIRLLTIDPPKLVKKTRLQSDSQPSETALARRTVSCEPDARIIVGRFAADPQAATFRVDAWGAMDQAELPNLMAALQRKDARVMWAAGGAAPQEAKVNRCEFLRQLGSNCVE